MQANSKKNTGNYKSSVYPIVGHLSKNGFCFSPDEKVLDVYEYLKHNTAITEFTIVNKDKVPIGFMTSVAIYEILGGRYGFSLYSNEPISKVINGNFLKVDHDMPINQVSTLAMQRSFEHLYDPIVVEKEGKYFGIVTIKDLLDICTKIEVDVAMHSNPLTGLPGNLLIEKKITDRIFGDRPFCITYYDLDNFKAYNDAYGFQNGDLMLTFVADILKRNAVKNEFVGHIGGDDFIVISDYSEGENYCKAVIEDFSSKITSFYRIEDIKNGYITSKNRQGVTENFPLASLSVAGISNKAKIYQNLDDFSKDIAQIKKKCKKQQGNYFEIL